MKLFFSLSRFKQIGVVVGIFHLFVVFFLLTSHYLGRKTPPPKPIGIRTLTALPAPKPAAVRKPSPKMPAKLTPSPASKPAAKTPSQAASPGKPVAGKTPNAKESVEENLLKELSKSLEACSAPATHSKTEFAISIPSAIQTQTPQISLSYSNACTEILQTQLILPELGTVTAEIEINSNGKIGKIEILNTQNEKNSAFLKKRLQELAFPCFNEFGLFENHLNFTITFRNGDIPYH